MASGPFPDVISDDGFVHRSFTPGERVVSVAASSVVRPAPTFGASLRRRVRVRQATSSSTRWAYRVPRVAWTDSFAELYAAGDHPGDTSYYLALVFADRLSSGGGRFDARRVLGD